MLRRDSHENQIPIYIESTAKDLIEMSFEEYQKQHHHNCIRVHEREISGIPQTEMYTHFNISPCYHKKGERYWITPIVGHKRHHTLPDQPIITLHNAVLYECIDVTEEVTYADLPKDVFTHSMGHIKSKEALRKTIIERYSYTGKNPDYLRTLPVSITYLKRCSID